MAFRFSWPEFDQEFYVEAKSQLETALNKGNKPSVIVDHITVKELNMGTKPPELEILEIGELGTDKFRGIFKLNYAGDAYIEVQTKVQANPMHAKTSDLPRHSRPGILAADQPLVVPMILRISELKLRGIVVLVVSKTKGVTLVFKNDPLESIRISSTFDSISILRDFLQRQIENQLRNMLQEDLPVMIHTLSLRIIESEQEKKNKKEQEDRLLKKRQSTAALSWNSSLPDLDHYPFSPSTSSSSSSSSSINSLFTPNLHHVDDIYYDYLTSPTSTVFSSNYLEQDSISTKKNEYADDYFHYCSSNNNNNNSSRSVPITAANLFTHNQLGLSSFKENQYQQQQQQNPIQFMMYQTKTRQQQQVDLISETGLSINTTPCLSMSDMYADDADAPWYAVEGPELSSSSVPFHMLPNDDDNNNQIILLNPFENSLTARLSALTTINYTLSPLTESISNFTFRSLPYVKKTTSTRHKKVPKRRITRLNMTIPRL